MKNRRGSLWGAGAEEMVMQFKAGDVVKPVIVAGLGFTGVVRDVDARINKVWVAWGNGRTTQHDPDEVQLALVQDPTVKARMASGRRVKTADEGFFADRVSGERLSTRRGSSSSVKATDIEKIVESEERLAPGDSSQTDFLSPEMERKLNEQVGVEFYSAYLYFIVAAWFQSKGLVGFQAWMERQGNDEVEHGMKVFKYLMDTGSKVDLPAIPAPKVDLSSVAEATRAVLDHEMLVTRLWKDIGELAKGEPNLATQELAQWFMTEQVEEEDGALTLHQKVQMADTGTGVLVLDNDLKVKDPNEVTASDRTARVHFSPGDKLLVRPMGSGLRKSYPASHIEKEMVVTVKDEGASEGLDVYDVVRDDGEEDSIYGTQVVRKVSRGASELTAGKKEVVEVDWRSEKGIRDAERKKSRLENQGYTLIETLGGLVTSKLVYVKKD